MSNAAVVKLQKKVVAGQTLWMDDNFGESIHIHIDDIRVDLTYRELCDMADNICIAIDELIQVEGFKCSEFDPVFVEQSLWKRISGLEKIVIEKVRLKDLYAGGKHIRPLAKSRIYKALKGDAKRAKVKRSSDHIGQSAAGRIKEIHESIKDSGYSTDMGYIVVFGNDNIIRDGQHRACALLLEKGDIEVPVMRMFFKTEKELNTRVRSFLRMPSFTASDVIRRMKENHMFSVAYAKKIAIKVLKKTAAVRTAINRTRYTIFAKKNYKLAKTALGRK